MLKKCIVCLVLKHVRFECDSSGSRNNKQIHEYNYSCYECLERNRSFFVPAIEKNGNTGS